MEKKKILNEKKWIADVERGKKKLEGNKNISSGNYIPEIGFFGLCFDGRGSFFVRIYFACVYVHAHIYDVLHR